MVYFGVMFYVYTFLKDEKEVPTIAIVGMILLAFLITGYVEAL
jgi:hypothetical protein